eukprot:230044-Amphidinium_carterae.1
MEDVTDSVVPPDHASPTAVCRVIPSRVQTVCTRCSATTVGVGTQSARRHDGDAEAHLQAMLVLLVRQYISWRSWHRK